jgi:DNA-binding NarL/FixJ family response regulator
MGPQGDAGATFVIEGGPMSQVSRAEVTPARPINGRGSRFGLLELEALSEREGEVVALAVLGIPLKIIASQLSISVQAVSTYLTRARRKLALPSRADLVKRLLECRTTGWTSSADMDRLTDAERSVWTAVASGMSNRTIARTRGTSVRTIEKQVSAIIGKCGLGSRGELFARAYLSEMAGRQSARVPASAGVPPGRRGGAERGSAKPECASPSSGEQRE